VTKVCKICNVEKDIEQYSLNKGCAGGRITRCKECINKLQKEQWHKNKELIAKKRSERRKNKIEQYREAERIRKKNYRKNNKEEINKKYREYMKNYRINNPSFRMQKRISDIIKKAIHQKISTFDIFIKLGYNVEDLMSHIESQFKDGMCWENYGEWHIDHIVPQSWLPFTSIEEENFIKCWQLSNLQPLWARDNISKSNRYSGSPENPIAFLCDLDFPQT